MHGNLITVNSNPRNIADAIKEADVAIGGVLIPGARASCLVTREMVKVMKPGSVVVDVCIDQGGCIEGSHPTSHSEPTYVMDGVTHYCVTNMPGAVPQTATHALSNVILPYALKLANLGFVQAVSSDTALSKGVNVHKSQITCCAVAEAFGLEYQPLERLL